MAENYPENHPDAVWLWPWPKDETREFFEDIQAVQAFAPGPEDTAIVKFLLLTGYQLDSKQARIMFRAIAVEACRMPDLSPAVLEAIVAKPLQSEKGPASYIEIPVAQIPQSAAAEFGADFAKLETLLPSAEREAGRGYAVEQSPDGYVLRTEFDNTLLK